MTAIERLREWLDSDPRSPPAMKFPWGTVNDAAKYARYLTMSAADVQAQIDKPTIPGVEKARCHARLQTLEADAQELLEAMPCSQTPTTASAATSDSDPPTNASEDSATPAGNG